MSLSLYKLQKLIVDNGIFPEKYYAINKYVVFIECVIIKTGQRFWLQIPNEYKFRADSTTGNDTYGIKYINTDEIQDEEVVKEFAKAFDDLEVFNSYEGDTSKIEDSFDQNNISNQLSKNYNYAVDIKDIDEEDINDIRDIKRQVDRLKYSVMQTNYSLCLTYKHYFSILVGGKTHVYQILNHNDSFSRFRQLIVGVDLILFYEKIDKVDVEVTKIKRSIEKILEMNYAKNINNINYMMDKSQIVIDKFNELHGKRDSLIELSQKYQGLYEYAVNSEKGLLENIQILRRNDMNVGKAEVLAADVKKIEQIKLDILNNIVKVNEKTDNISLTLDTILFDNIVMFNSIIKNFETLISFTNT